MSIMQRIVVDKCFSKEDGDHLSKGTIKNI